MLVVKKDGWVNHAKITLAPKKAIEHSPLPVIKAVVLHRTDTVHASSVLNAWETRKMGAHFLISETGKIYQTASLKSQCWHVGKLYARCQTVSSCTDEDAKEIEDILHKKNMSWGKKYKLVTRHELKKKYPLRFPHNHDSIGIEVVGKFPVKKEIYEIPNKLQLDAVFWLLDELVATYGVTLNDIYAHGRIAHKDSKKSEGAATLKAYSVYRSGKAQ